MMNNCRKFGSPLVNSRCIHFYKLNKPNLRNIITASAVATSTNIEPKWQLVASACITRSPIISAKLKPIEKVYKQLVETEEVEGSLKSDHEIKMEEDKIKNELLKLGNQDHIDLEEASKLTAAEFEDASLEELKSFEFASTITDADASNDMTSINRALDRSLVLIVNQKLGSKYQWVFPQTPWIPGETLRQSCERVVHEICGHKLKVKILGNSPCGFFKYKYPKEVRKLGYIGAKVFFFAGHVLAFDSEGLEKNENFTEYLWLTHEELKPKLNKSYFKSVSQFLIPDD